MQIILYWDYDAIGGYMCFEDKIVGDKQHKIVLYAPSSPRELKPRIYRFRYIILTCLGNWEKVWEWVADYIYRYMYAKMFTHYHIKIKKGPRKKMKKKWKKNFGPYFSLLITFLKLEQSGFLFFSFCTDIYEIHIILYKGGTLYKSLCTFRVHEIFHGKTKKKRLA